MHRFWEKVIKPLVLALQPRVIVEVGSFTGLNTFKLLDYCRYTGAKCVVIDPAPLYDTELMKSYYGETLSLRRLLSIEALPQIGAYDMILIDGDHNWYTVYHELKLVERMAREKGKPFPVTVLHDTGWPYARRDMYYAPETIPEAYRQPCEKKGLEPGFEGLLEQGGLNNMVHNAVREHGPRNGVLTAIEDFLQEAQQPLSYYELSSNNGLGVIIPSSEPLRGILTYILDTSGQ
ncbi:putative O-methyltransferase YrrM [Fontibacillus phaseoli]|uniref:Putative O-methyltransferase YrrM n=1 Tax=Fontibacillus phaseoli TaxID=1416533 RepID=A0A369BNU0_9BACL|nr:class I SAM-dependent methyltransferase [Fontibacillus phaseoli]RCX21344.1 putative O-methyltransferase YrrM [Fontibacillus phaseoli]